jgi:ribosome biogenesis GTPase
MVSSDFAALGWSDELDAAFAEYRRRGLIPARVVLEHNHVYRVMAAGQDEELLAETTGRMKHRAEGRHDLPAVGDWVALRLGAPGSRAVVDAVLPRRSYFSRKAAGRQTREQVVAANIDVVLIVFGLDAPVNARAIERYVLQARRSGARPVVVLNKADLCGDVAAAVAEAGRAAADAPVHAVSARAAGGLASLRALLRSGETMALLGPSGAGKSSIVNALAGRPVLPTGEVREWDVRGRHTSVHRQLERLEGGGNIIDTPGLRELQLWESEDGLDPTFADLAAIAGSCRFRDCRHATEPGCAVKAAVESGVLDRGRYENYVKLQQEREALDQKRDERSYLEAKRQAKVANKALKRLQKDREL